MHEKNLRELEYLSRAVDRMYARSYKGGERDGGPSYGRRLAFQSKTEPVEIAAGKAEEALRRKINWEPVWQRRKDAAVAKAAMDLQKAEVAVSEEIKVLDSYGWIYKLLMTKEKENQRIRVVNAQIAALRRRFELDRIKNVRVDNFMTAGDDLSRDP